MLVIKWKEKMEIFVHLQRIDKSERHETTVLVLINISPVRPTGTSKPTKPSLIWAVVYYSDVRFLLIFDDSRLWEKPSSYETKDLDFRGVWLAVDGKYYYELC